MSIPTSNPSSGYDDWLNETQNQQHLNEYIFDFIDFENVNIPVVNPDTLQLDGTKFITLKNHWERLIQLCDMLRFLWCVTQDEKYFNELMRILPKSYKVVEIG